MRLSKQFWSEIQTYMNRMRDAEVREVGPSELQMSVPHSALAERVMWGEHHHLKALMPYDWMGKTPTVDFMFSSQAFKPFSVRCDSRAAILLPPGCGTYRPDVYISDDTFDTYDERDYPELAELKKLCAIGVAKAQVRTKWQDAFNSLRALFMAYASVSQACAACPELRVFLRPEHVVKLKVPKRPQPRFDTGVNVPALVALAVEAKLRQHGARHESR